MASLLWYGDCGNCQHSTGDFQLRAGTPVPEALPYIIKADGGTGALFQLVYNLVVGYGLRRTGIEHDAVVRYGHDYVLLILLCLNPAGARMGAWFDAMKHRIFHQRL